MASTLDFLPQMVKDQPLWKLKEHFDDNAQELKNLFDHYVYKPDWTEEHPELALKAISILDRENQADEDIIRVIDQIAATRFLSNSSNGLDLIVAHAIENRNWDLLISLINKGLNPDYELDFGNFILHEAVSHEQIAAVRMLIEKEVKIDQPGTLGNTALHIAAEKGNAELVRLLLSAQADTEIMNQELKTPLFLACEIPDNADAAFVLLAGNADPNVFEAWDMTPFLHAICTNKEDLALSLIDKITNLEHTNARNQTALHLACLHKCPLLIARLLDKEVKLNVIDKSGNTPLHYACKAEIASAICNLVIRGANCFIKNRQKKMPFFPLLRRDNTRLIKLLSNMLPQEDWLTGVLDQILLMEKEEEANEMIEIWKGMENPWKIVEKAVTYPSISEYLLRSHKEWINEYRSNILALPLTPEQKHSLLPLFPPDDIAKIIGDVASETIDEWLEEIVLVGEGIEDDYLFETVHMGIQTANREWVQYINWSDPDPLSISRRLMVDLSEFLNRIPLKSLAGAIWDITLQPILSRCIAILSPDQLTVIIPQFDLDDFLNAIMNNDTMNGHTMLLKVATNEQKKRYLEEIPLQHDSIIDNWIHLECEKITRELEVLVEAFYNKKSDIGEGWQALIQTIEAKSLILPGASRRNTHKLEALKRALLLNNPPEDILRMVRTTVDPFILQSKTVIEQIERIKRSIYEDSILKTTVIVEEEMPQEFLCGIMQTPMTHPVTAHGHTFELSSIAEWLKKHHTCPICRKGVSLADFIPNDELRERIIKHGTNLK